MNQHQQQVKEYMDGFFEELGDIYLEESWRELEYLVMEALETGE